MTLPILFGIAGTLVLCAVLASLVWGKRPDDYLDDDLDEYEDEIDEYEDACDDDEIDEDDEDDFGGFARPAALVTPVAPAETLGALGAKVGAVNRANGWRTYNTPNSAWDANPYYVPAVLMLIVSEAAEALEAYRKDDREHFHEEVADMLIRVLDLADLLGIDLDNETYRKLEKNALRGFRHGGKRV